MTTRPEQNPARGWIPAAVALGILGVGGAVALGVSWMRRDAPTPGAPADAGNVVPAEAWNSGDRITVQRSTLYRTTVSTAFPGGTLGVIIGKLADQGASMQVELVETVAMVGSFRRTLEIWTGTSPGPVEILLQTVAAKRKLKLLIV